MERPDQDLDPDLTPVPAPTAYEAEPRAEDESQEFRSTVGEQPAQTEEQTRGLEPLMEQARSALRFADETLRRQLEERPYVVLAGAVGAGVVLGGGVHLAGVALRAGRRAAFNFALNHAIDLVLPKVEKRS
jgi:hypothetical protein